MAKLLLALVGASMLANAEPAPPVSTAEPVPLSEAEMDTVVGGFSHAGGDVNPTIRPDTFWTTPEGRANLRWNLSHRW